LDAIDHETKEVCIAMNTEMAEEIAHILKQYADGRNPAIWAMGQQIANAVGILMGRRRIEAFREFRDVEVIGDPPPRVLGTPSRSHEYEPALR